MRLIDIKQHILVDTYNTFPDKSEDLLDTLKDNKEKIKEIKRIDLPEKAMDTFEKYSHRFISPDDHKKGFCDKYRYIDHNDSGYITYLGLSTDKEYEDNIYICELDTATGDKIGRGEIRYGKQYKSKDKSFYKNKPFVGFSATEDGFYPKGIDYTHRGYGKKRLITMNAITQQVRGLKLHSSTTFCHLDQKKNTKKFNRRMISKRI